MSTTKRSISVTREYKESPEDCVRALGLLLQAPFNSQTNRGGSHDLTGNSIKECTTRQDKKGMQNADLHGN